MKLLSKLAKLQGKRKSGRVLYICPVIFKKSLYVACFITARMKLPVYDRVRTVPGSMITLLWGMSISVLLLAAILIFSTS